MISKLCEFSKDQRWQLVYRATEHGFGFNDFHSKCANKCSTIIKSDHGNVFGGYTDAAWNKSDGYSADQNAFLFSRINRDNNPCKIKCLSPQEAVRGHSGPYIQCYGSATDFGLCSNSNVNKESYYFLGNSYNHPFYATDFKESNRFLAGSNYFQTLEI